MKDFNRLLAEANQCSIKDIADRFTIVKVKCPCCNKELKLRIKQ